MHKKDVAEGPGPLSNSDPAKGWEIRAESEGKKRV
jgi:hypothetical protein